MRRKGIRRLLIRCGIDKAQGKNIGACIKHRNKKNVSFPPHVAAGCFVFALSPNIYQKKNEWKRIMRRKVAAYAKKKQGNQVRKEQEKLGSKKERFQGANNAERSRRALTGTRDACVHNKSLKIHRWNTERDEKSRFPRVSQKKRAQFVK